MLGSYFYYGMGGKYSIGNEFMEIVVVIVVLIMLNVFVDIFGLKS